MGITAQTYTNTLPANLQQEHRSVFEKNVTYSVSPLKVSEVKNVLVTRSGLCIKGLRWYADSATVNPHVAGMFNRMTLYNVFFKWRQKTNPGNTYTVVHNVWSIGGYYFWLTETLARVLLIKDRAPHLILLLPERALYVPYVQDSLRCIPFKGVEFIPNNRVANVKNLVLPQNPCWSNECDPNWLTEARQLYRNAVKEYSSGSVYAHKKIYVSRRKSRGRKIKNESSLEKVMQDAGYVSICFEDLTFWDQVDCMQHAESFVSIHGAGLANMLFMASNTTVLELVRKPDKYDTFHRKAYWNMASCLNIRYFYQFCTPVDVLQDFDKADLIVDIPLLKKNLAQMSETIA